MFAEQQALVFKPGASKAPAVSNDDAQIMREALADGQWHLGRDLTRQIGFDERKLREVAEVISEANENDEIISTNNGYRFMRDATCDEIRVSLGRLESQIKKMTAKLIRRRNAAHRRLAAVPQPAREHITLNAQPSTLN